MGIRSKLVALTIGVALLAAVVFDTYLAHTLWAELSDQTASDLAARTALAAARVAQARDIGAEAPAIAEELSRAAGARVTVIDPRGVVRGDSAVAPTRLDDLDEHGGRPEVVAALQGGTGRDERKSRTTRMRMLYAAQRLDRPDGPWVVRLAFAPVAIDATVSAARRRALEGTSLALAVALGAALLASGALSRRLLHLTRTARALRGDLGRRARVGGRDEIAALGAALDDLADTLQRSLAELSGERDRFGAVLESMREGVLVTDEEDKVALVNPALAALLGVRGDAAGKPPLEVLRNAALHGMLERVARTGAAASEEIEVARPRPASATPTPSPDRPPLPPPPRRLLVNAAPLAARAGVVAVFFDVTELRRLESLRRDFVANASHELRTPVAAVRASAETLLGGALSNLEDAREFVEVIDRSAARLHRLVDDLLDLSRIEAGARPLSVVPVDLRERAEAAASLLAARAEARRSSVAIEIPEGARAVADPGALDQVITNLVENALLHTPPGSHVTIRARPNGRLVILEVEDDGPGIPLPHRERVFERFYRVDPGRSREAGGTGLGLSIVRHLVEAMHGQVAVAAGRTGGALLRVTLPAPEGAARPSAPGARA